MAYKKIEQYDEAVTDELKKNYTNCLSLLGEDPQREGLLKTPERVAKAMQFLTQGYYLDPKAILDSAKFHEEVSEMIIVKDIEIYSMCEHHMLPFLFLLCLCVLMFPGGAFSDSKLIAFYCWHS